MGLALTNEMELFTNLLFTHYSRLNERSPLLLFLKYEAAFSAFVVFLFSVLRLSLDFLSLISFFFVSFSRNYLNFVTEEMIEPYK